MVSFVTPFALWKVLYCSGNLIAKYQNVVVLWEGQLIVFCESTAPFRWSNLVTGLTQLNVSRTTPIDDNVEKICVKFKIYHAAILGDRQIFHRKANCHGKLRY
jgi:hypothetical protein